MPPLIKVCGIQSVEEAQGAVAAGANTIGLLVGLTHVAEDKISPETAKEIVSRLPQGILAVMVTHLLDPGEIAGLARFAGVGAVQIHDDLPVQGVKQLRTLLPGILLIKAVHVTGPEALDNAKMYAADADMLLLDSRTKDRLGGTGKIHDWNLSRQIVQLSPVPVILAGGIKPENAAQAIEMVKPAGIDANSDLENPDGSKNFDKIKTFAAAGRACGFGPSGSSAMPGKPKAKRPSS